MSAQATTARACTATAQPSLALVKYWGKKTRGVNLPATTSVAVTLSHLCSTVRVSLLPQTLQASEAVFELEGREQDAARLRVLCEAVDARFGSRSAAAQLLKMHRLRVRAENNFATAAGLASSASGGAALTRALLGALGLHCSTRAASALARHYSGSACRSLFGGFVQWKRGAHYATPLVDERHWSDFRVIVLTLTNARKGMSSRAGMEITRKSSAYYPAWVRSNKALAREARRAIMNRDIEKLGEIAVRSYSAMHASAFAAYRPVLYWQPASLAVLHAVHAMRKNNLAVWETMDAGPQVKLITLEGHVAAVQDALTKRVVEEHGTELDMRVCGVGACAALVKEP